MKSQWVSFTLSHVRILLRSILCARCSWAQRNLLKGLASARGGNRGECVILLQVADYDTLHLKMKTGAGLRATRYRRKKNSTIIITGDHCEQDLEEKKGVEEP